MGPTCEVNLLRLDEVVLDEIDRLLKNLADEVVPSRKGCVWDVRLSDRPIHVCIDADSMTLLLSAGCNQAEDLAIIEQLASELVFNLTGTSQNP